MSKFDSHILNCYYYCNKLHYNSNNTFLNKRIKKLIYRYYSFILKFLYGAFIPYRAKIGKNIKFIHSFHGIFISQYAEIGENCQILHQVTIGSNIQKKQNNVSSKIEAPIIGNNVFIRANAIIIGRSVIEDNCKIGAGTTVTNLYLKKNSTVFNNNIKILNNS